MISKWITTDITIIFIYIYTIFQPKEQPKTASLLCYLSTKYNNLVLKIIYTLSAQSKNRRTIDLKGQRQRVATFCSNYRKSDTQKESQCAFCINQNQSYPQLTRVTISQLKGLNATKRIIKRFANKPGICDKMVGLKSRDYVKNASKKRYQGKRKDKGLQFKVVPDFLSSCARVDSPLKPQTYIDSLRREILSKHSSKFKLLESLRSLQISSIHKQVDYSRRDMAGSENLLQFVEIISLLLGNRDLLSNFGGVVWINIKIGDIGVFVECDKDLAKRVDQSRVAPGLVDFGVLLVLRYAYAYGVALVVECSASQQQLPVQGTSRLVEASRVQEYSSAFLGHHQGKLCKPDVVTYPKAHFAVFCIKHTNLMTWAESLRLIVGDLTRNIDVEKMRFVILFLELSFGIYDEGSIEKLLIGFARDGADCVHFVVKADLFDGVESGRVREIFGKLMHVALDVGGVADFSEDGHVGAVLPCL